MRKVVDGGEGGYYTPCDGWYYMGDCWIGSPKDGNAHAALVEALAGFVWAAHPAEYLAQPNPVAVLYGRPA